MLVGSNFISMNWHETSEGQEIMISLMHRNMHKRKPFGVLEYPSLPPQLSPDEFEYKIFVSGRSGVGKTSTCAKLSANQVPTTHSETPGIQTSVVYWPALIKDLNKIVMFKLKFWDAGENALKKFDHVLPACKEKADAILFVFSFADKTSFEDLPQQMSRILDANDNVAKFVLGTKLDLHSQGQVTQQDISDFEENWRLPIISIKNIPDCSQTESRSDVPEIAPILNFICDQLWRRDQILAGKLAATH